METSTIYGPRTVTKLIENNLSMRYEEGGSPKLSWKLIVLLMLLTIFVNYALWLVMFSVTSLEGNLFVNGLIFGASEFLSAIVCGVVIEKFADYLSAYTVFQILCVLGILGNTINQFWVEQGSFLAYFTLFIGILGVSGVYTVLYVILSIAVPREQVAGIMTICFTIAIGACMGAPMIALLEPPTPYVCLASVLALSFTTSVLIQRTSKQTYYNN